VIGIRNSPIRRAAAGYAYRGHGIRWANLDERARIQSIENEEWHHRELVGEMLNPLGAGPNRVREFRASIIGRVLGFCVTSAVVSPHVCAGKLESKNIVEYETAARYARACGHEELSDCF